jgi:hypothetical protein
MTISRYSRDDIINRGKAYGSAEGVMRIREAVRQNRLAVSETVLEQASRLDVMAGQKYGDASLWWVIAAASNIGWGLQVPAGTRVLIPSSIEQIAEIVE